MSWFHWFGLLGLFFAEASGFRAGPVLGESLRYSLCVCYQHSVAANAAHSTLSGETTKNMELWNHWGWKKPSTPSSLALTKHNHGQQPTESMVYAEGCKFTMEI